MAAPRPQNYVNISSGCTDRSLPSLYGYYDATDKILMFRWRVEQIANTYATGPNAGAYASSDAWNSALWTVLYDLDGDGYRDLAAHLNGSSGSPSVPIDRLAGIWGENSNSQSIDYISDPTIHLVAQNYASYVITPSNRILNFGSSLSPAAMYPAVSPSGTWPNGANERIWNYGMSRSVLVTTSPCTEYFVDYQIPVEMLDASAIGGPTIGDKPFSMLFCTANSLQNPMQKDCAANTSWIADPAKVAQLGDLIVISPTNVITTVQQPVVAVVTASGCGPTTLTADVRDTISATNGVFSSSVISTTFYAYYDADANGSADDAGSSWIPVANGSATGLTGWTAAWDSTAYLQGQWLIGVRAADNPAYNIYSTPRVSNVTFSYYQTQSDLNTKEGAPPTGQAWWANGAVWGTAVIRSMVNTCGAPPLFLAKTVTPTIVAGGDEVTFTLSISNTGSEVVTVTVINDILPAGFRYVRNAGGSLTPLTSPSINLTGTITWTLNAGIAPASTGTLSFVAQAADRVGTYNNVATAIAGGGKVTSPPAEVGVGEPRLTIAKSVTPSSVDPGGVITYTITYANDSAVSVRGAILSDLVPEGLENVTPLAGGSYDSGTRTATWNVGTVAAGDGPFTVQFTATVTIPFSDTICPAPDQYRDHHLVEDCAGQRHRAALCQRALPSHVAGQECNATAGAARQKCHLHACLPEHRHRPGRKRRHHRPDPRFLHLCLSRQPWRAQRRHRHMEPGHGCRGCKGLGDGGGAGREPLFRHAPGNQHRKPLCRRRDADHRYV